MPCEGGCSPKSGVVSWQTGEVFFYQSWTTKETKGRSQQKESPISENSWEKRGNVKELET